MAHNSPSLFLLELGVLPLQVAFYDECGGGDYEAGAAHNATTDVVSWLLPIREHVARVEVGYTSGHEVVDGQGCSALGSRSWERRAEPANTEVIWAVGPTGHQEHGEVSASSGLYEHG